MPLRHISSCSDTVHGHKRLPTSACLTRVSSSLSPDFVTYRWWSNWPPGYRDRGFEFRWGIEYLFSSFVQCCAVSNYIWSYRKYRCALLKKQNDRKTNIYKFKTESEILFRTWNIPSSNLGKYDAYSEVHCAFLRSLHANVRNSALN
jgi:hypothetical protein